MKEKELKDILRRNFNFEENWKPLFSMLFSQVQYFSNPSNPFSESAKVVSGKQTGIVKLNDGKQLAIFEVEVDDSIRIDKNRQGLREIAIKHIDQNITHGAFVFFYSKNQKDYRFSFIARWSEIDLETGEFKKGETKPKRYTYLLGDNEACTTAAKRLLMLAAKRDNHEIGIKDIIDTFSVEALNKEFFKTYKEHYERFWRFIANPDNTFRDIILDKDENKEEIKREKPIRDFAKKLLGRIVFLHFLQKKGWMGCDAKTTKWENGEKQFMQILYSNFSDKAHFHSKCLTKLFFSTLNTRRNNDIFEIEGLTGKLNGSRVPYLNGGLFDTDKPEAVLTIDFPEKYFAELFDFFEQYNFTIDENSPDDHEVGIDPEMLGHIFENLLEENREKGAFYTPKEIVQYMCKESLIQYLKNTPPLEGWQTKSDGVVNSPPLEELSKTGVVNSPPLEELSKTGVARSSQNYFNLPYNPKLKERARELRKAGYLSEVLFWNRVKNKQFKGFDFDRQKIIGNYIVDFFCTNCNVIIEIDGSSHDDKQEYDALRDEFLQSLGLTVIHISVKDVMNNLDGVMEMLSDHPSLKDQTPEDGNESPPTHPVGGNWEEKITRFIRNHDASMFNATEAIIIDEALDNIKVCDPAIGSGAFPIGMLQEIFEAKKFIYPYLKTNREFNPARIKKDIIQKSIYGVDLEKGAVDIAQLRFWLALVVDEENPHPLPNLDYKIMQGNSLLESFEGIDLSKAAFFEEPNVTIIEPTLFEEPGASYGFSEKNKSDIKSLINDYFKIENKEQKSEIRKLIDRIVLDHIDKSLEFFENRLLIEIADLDHRLKNKLERLKDDQKELYKAKSKELKEIEKRQILLTNRSDARKRLLAFEHTDERPYFLWHLYFMDVFEKGGFDVIIGNPPYIQLQKMGKDADILQDAGFKTFRRTGDIYTLFYERGIDILKDKGTLTYITSNTWMRTNFGEGLREFFVTKSNPEILLNFEDTKIFPTATVEVSIMVTKKEKWNKNLLAVAIKGDYDPSKDIINYIFSNLLKLTELNSEEWFIGNKEEIFLKNSIERKGIKISDLPISIYRGITTGLNEAFFIDEETKEMLINEDFKSNDIIKPLLRGRELSKYFTSTGPNYIIFTRRGIEIDDYPAIKRYLNQFYDKLIPKTNKNESMGRKPGDYKWFEIQDNTAYYQEFEKEKLFWIQLSDINRFSYSDTEVYATNSCFLMTLKDSNNLSIKYLNAILNSKLVEYYFKTIGSTSGVGTLEWTKISTEKIPILISEIDIRLRFERIVDYLIILKDDFAPSIMEHASNEMISQQFEEVLNMMVYELYFEEHMKGKEIDVLQFVNFPDISKMQSFEDKRDTIQKVYYWLKEKDNPIRNRILVSESRSWIIKRINESTH